MTQLRYGLRVYPSGELRGLAYWSGSTGLTLAGVTYAPGEIGGLGSYELALSGRSRPVEVLLAGEDPVLREWLLQGPGLRDVELLLLLSEDGSAWTVGSSVRGIVSTVVRTEDGGFSLTIDSELGAPTPGLRLVWSDESQRDLYPGDRFFEGLVPLSKGVSLVWPG